VQHEHKPLCGIQGVEHHKQRETDRVGQQRFAFGVDSVPVAYDAVGYLYAKRPIAP